MEESVCGVGGADRSEDDRAVGRGGATDAEDDAFWLEEAVAGATKRLRSAISLCLCMKENAWSFNDLAVGFRREEKRICCFDHVET